MKVKFSSVRILEVKRKEYIYYYIKCLYNLQTSESCTYFLIRSLAIFNIEAITLIHILLQTSFLREREITNHKQKRINIQFYLRLVWVQWPFMLSSFSFQQYVLHIYKYVLLKHSIKFWHKDNKHWFSRDIGFPYPHSPFLSLVALSGEGA